MAMTGGKDDGSPMMEINTTPLIDVMLVLLIMFIITIPVATHAVNIDLPSPKPPPPDNVVKPTKNIVSITPQSVVLWNGVPINNGQLVSDLNATMKIKPEPELQFQPDAQAPYDMTAKVLNIIKASGVTAFGFVGNEQYYQFDKAKGAPPAKP